MYSALQSSWRQTFLVQLYVKPHTSRFKAISGAASWTKLLGAWFDVFPIALSEISASLEAQMPEEHEADDSETIEKLMGKHNNYARNYRHKLCLESTQESKGLGGTSEMRFGFSDTLRRYFGEILIENVINGEEGETCPSQGLGIVSLHRNMRKAGENLPSNSETQAFRFLALPGVHDMCYLKTEERPLAFCLREACKDVFYGTQSLSGIVAHAEDLGHPEIRYISGLTVELLPFQRQSVQWALDRETAEGGIQSWLWPQLPRVAQPRKKTVYFNPVLEIVRTEKPHLVRGGIIGSEMGKRLFCLGAVLR